MHLAFCSKILQSLECNPGSVQSQAWSLIEQNWIMLTDYEEVAHLLLLDFDGLIPLFAEISQFLEMVEISQFFEIMWRLSAEPAEAAMPAGLLCPP